MWAFSWLVSVVLGALVLVYLYERVMHPFWAKQPVFHRTDLTLWASTGQILSADVPLINSYVDFQKSLTRHITAVPEGEVSAIAEFITTHYSGKDGYEYSPDTDYLKQSLSAPRATLSVWKDEALIGTITSRPLRAILPGLGSYDIDYVDNLTIHKDYRKRGVAARLIQSHLAADSQEVNKNKIQFFKREGTTNPIVPIVRYYTEVYSAGELPDVANPGREVPKSDFPTAIRAIYEDSERHKLSVMPETVHFLRDCEQSLFRLVKTVDPDGSLRALLLMRHIPVRDANGRQVLEIATAVPMKKHVLIKDEITALLASIKNLVPNSIVCIERLGRLSDVKLTVNTSPVKCPMSFFFL